MFRDLVSFWWLNRFMKVSWKPNVTKCVCVLTVNFYTFQWCPHHWLNGDQSKISVFRFFVVFFFFSFLKCILASWVKARCICLKANCFSNVFTNRNAVFWLQRSQSKLRPKIIELTKYWFWSWKLIIFILECQSYF